MSRRYKADDEKRRLMTRDEPIARDKPSERKSRVKQQQENPHTQYVTGDQGISGLDGNSSSPDVILNSENHSPEALQNTQDNVPSTPQATREQQKKRLHTGYSKLSAEQAQPSSDALPSQQASGLQHSAKYQQRFAKDAAKQDNSESAPSPGDSQLPDHSSEKPGGLQFTADEKAPVSDKKLSKLKDKADKQAVRLDEARNKLPSKKRVKVKRIYDEAKGKRKTKIQFEKEVVPQGDIKPPVSIQAGKAAGHAAGHAAGRTAANAYHRKIAEVEDENVGVRAARKAEQHIEGAFRKQRITRNAYRFVKERPYRHVAKLEKKAVKANIKLSYRQALTDNPKLKSNILSRMMQKRKIKKQYAKAARNAKRAGTAAKKAAVTTEKIASKIVTTAARHPVVTLVLALLLVLMLIVMSTFSSCSSMAIGTFGAIATSCYLADDADINNAELVYTEWETDLQMLINNIEHDHPGFDEYHYSVDDIGHDPFELMGFLTAVYQDFKYADIQPVLRQIFNEQYTLELTETTETRTETRLVEVGQAIGQVRTTAYCPCVICCGVWAGGATASGVMPRSSHTIAVDAHNPLIPMGTKVVINGTEYTVEDTGNLNANNTDFDIFFDTHAEAIAWGRRTHTAYLADGNVNTVEVTTTSEVRILNINLTANSFTASIVPRMDAEQLQVYALLMQTKGNRQYALNVFNFNWLPYVSSYYGYRVHPTSGAKDYHKGIDIAVASGTEILAGHDGKVSMAGNSGDYGLVVVIEGKTSGGGTLVTKYAHCSELLVSNGQTVKKGDVIAKVGSTGNSTGAHLHLELLVDGEYLNPIYFAETGDDGSGRIPPGNPGGRPIPDYPGAPMDDARFAALMEEAIKHLGKPYVFGAAGPNSFDCSGFVSYVLTQSGVANVGRDTAQGLYNRCTPVSRANAQPGDLIFFTGTYSAGRPVTHIGIYIGNGQMIHAGKPVQYSSIDTPYWTEHFYAFGRISGN